MDVKEFKTAGLEVIDWINEYRKNVHNYDVFPDIEPGYLSRKLPESPPENPEPFSDTFHKFKEIVMKGMVHWNHPQFHAYFSSGNSLNNVFADAIGAALGTMNFSWYANPVGAELETIVMDWTARVLGLPHEFMFDRTHGVGGGCLLGSASECTLVATMAARYRALKFLKGDNEDLHPSHYLTKLVAYSCSEAHSSVEKAAGMAVLKMRILPSNDEGQMDANLLKQTMLADLDLGLIPCLVVVTTGTTGLAAFDDVLAAADVIETVKTPYPVWLHVDGAYGGAFFMLEERKELSKGMSRADSFNFNPNKQMLAAFDCSCFWTKDVKIVQEGLYINPYYLVTSDRGPRQIDYRHYGIALSRRFRALKLWFHFRTYGISNLKAYLRNLMAMAKLMEEKAKADGRFDIVNNVLASMVCIAYKRDNMTPDEANKKTKSLIDLLDRGRKLHLIGHFFKKRTTIRIAIVYDKTTAADVEKSWGIIKEAADELDRNPHMKIKQNRSLWRSVPREVYDTLCETPRQQEWGPIYVPQ